MLSTSASRRSSPDSAGSSSDSPGTALVCAAALERVDAGDPEWLTSPRLDSYHTVWMQMHEDLLLAIGAERAHETGD